MPARILITGSRSWVDVQTIRSALEQVFTRGCVLVSGACPRGADRIAEQVWTELGGSVERHRVNWSKYGKSAGLSPEC